METSFGLLSNLEIRDMIYSYCRISDLVNLACCSKAHYSSVVHIIWRELRIPWHALATKSKAFPLKLENLRFTKSIVFYPMKRKDSAVDENSEEKKIFLNFKLVIKHCRKLITLFSECSGFSSSTPTSTTTASHLVIKPSWRMLSNLREVYLTNYKHVEKGWLRGISSLQYLRTLNLIHCQLEDSDIEEIAKVKKLKELSMIHDFRELSITKKTFEYISSLINLTKLVMSNFEGIDSNGFKHFGKLQDLTELDLRAMNINDETLINICQSLTNLEILRIDQCKEVSDIGVTYINKLVSLKALIISYTNITDDATSYISSLISLKTLDIGCNVITHIGLAHISKLVLLQKLHIHRSCIIDAALPHIAKLTSLTDLDLSGNEDITDNGIASLSSMPLLRVLNIQWASITDISLSHISKLTVLEELNVSDTLITNLGISYLQNLSCLKKLNIAWNNVSDECISYLNCLASLESLTISSLVITEAGRSRLRKLINIYIDSDTEEEEVEDEE